MSKIRNQDEIRVEREKKERLEELKGLKPITFEELEDVFNKWIIFADSGLLRFHVAVLVAHFLGIESGHKPLWVFLVGASGGGKTMMLETLDDLPFCYFLSSLTPQSLISGINGASLLTQINNRILINKDWTTILAMNYDAKNEILGQLRQIYDGEYSKKFGNSNEKVEWRGRVSFYAATTDMIDLQQQAFGALGERFIYYRIEMPDRKEVSNKMFFNNDHKKEMKKELCNAVYSYFLYLKDKIPKNSISLPKEIKDDLVLMSDLITTARSQVVRENSFRKDVVLVPSPEMPTRLTEELDTLIKALGIIRGGKIEEEDIKIGFKVALDSLPKVVRLILKTLAGENGLHHKEISMRIRYPASLIKMQCENLTMLGALGKADRGVMAETDTEDAEKKKDRWFLKEDYRKIMIKYDQIEVMETIVDKQVEQIQELFGGKEVPF